MHTIPCSSSWRTAILCPKCGTRNPDGSSSCQKCATPITSASAKLSATSTGLQPNVAGLLSYALLWVTGLLFIIVEKRDRFVRFHAMQSTVVFGCLSVLSAIFWLLTAIPFVGAVFLLLNVCSGVFAFVLWVILMVKAYKGQRYKIPVAGDFAEKHTYGARVRQELKTESADGSSSRGRTLWAIGIGLLIVALLAIVISQLYLRH